VLDQPEKSHFFSNGTSNKVDYCFVLQKKSRESTDGQFFLKSKRLVEELPKKKVFRVQLLMACV